MPRNCHSEQFHREESGKSLKLEKLNFLRNCLCEGSAFDLRRLRDSTVSWIRARKIHMQPGNSDLNSQKRPARLKLSKEEMTRRMETFPERAQKLIDSVRNS